MVLGKWRPSLEAMPWRAFWPSDGERNWTPALDIMEKDDRFVVKAELPGMNEEDIDVSVTGDTLTIKGEKKAEEIVDGENYYHMERTFGSFMRSISLPSNVNSDKIEARYENGVLEIILPKTVELKPKKVKLTTKKKSEK